MRNFIALVFCLSLTSCISPYTKSLGQTPFSETITSLKPVAATSSATRQLTQTPTKTTTASPTRKFTKILTALPITTSTFTKTPTWTPWPTLSQDDSYDLVLDLFEKNAGCDLPCWWGLIPGESSWLESRGFLEQFAQLNTLVSDEEPYFYMDILVPVPEQVNHQPLQQIYGVRNNIIETIEIQLGNAPVADLSEFLVRYGQPGEIWLSTYSTTHSSDVLPFIVYLFYPEKGILAINGPENVTINGVEISGCNFDKPASKYGLWSIKQKMTFKDASHVFRMNISEPGFLVLLIQDATNMDVETFYETFKEPNTTCIKTPIEIWPEQ